LFRPALNQDRHGEERSDEAIQHGSLAALDCFATLAKTIPSN